MHVLKNISILISNTGNFVDAIDIKKIFGGLWSFESVNRPASLRTRQTGQLQQSRHVSTQDSSWVAGISPRTKTAVGFLDPTPWWGLLILARQDFSDHRWLPLYRSKGRSDIFSICNSKTTADWLPSRSHRLNLIVVAPLYRPLISTMSGQNAWHRFTDLSALGVALLSLYFGPKEHHSTN